MVIKISSTPSFGWEVNLEAIKEGAEDTQWEQKPEFMCLMTTVSWGSRELAYEPLGCIRSGKFLDHDTYPLFSILKHIPQVADTIAVTFCFLCYKLLTFLELPHILILCGPLYSCKCLPIVGDT
jgi:hypothetical protein